MHVAMSASMHAARFAMGCPHLLCTYGHHVHAWCVHIAGRLPWNGAHLGQDCVLQVARQYARFITAQIKVEEVSEGTG